MPYVIAVDDEIDVLSTLGRAIERDNIKVKLLNISTEAIDVIIEEKPDLVILDIIMPGIDGVTICRRLRANPDFVDLPILFLTAKGRTDDVVVGLDAGADDYIVKPFHLAELRARVGALLRRGMRESTDTGAVAVGGLRLKASTHQVIAEDETIQLTATEYRLLRYLMENVNQPQSPVHLLESVWDYPPDTGDPDLVRAHVRNLRSKLKSQTGQRFIETVHGVGYIINDTVS
ncbi:MAG: response regulator transcription factor [Chloroflexota bacterium]